jgi:hypothetical protein
VRRFGQEKMTGRPKPARLRGISMLKACSKNTLRF